MLWLAQAPSNIALIKYMGKKDASTNIPMNASLSYTLDHLLSSVSLEPLPGKQDFWEPLSIPGTSPFALSLKGQKRFLDHLAFLKKQLGSDQAFVVKSATNFPQGAGLASSASSFAALTKCAVSAITEIQNSASLSSLEMAKLSRMGSGSSCRSFFSPWALWEREDVKDVDLPYKKLHHEVILISHDEKKIASSEAHSRVQTSEHYNQRAERAQTNLSDLLTALQTQNWAKAYAICWNEFQDMHKLFATCEQPFSYMNENAEKVLRQLQKFWDKLGDGPLVTMDAGPNIHLLYRPDQLLIAQEFKKHYLLGNYDVL